MKWIERVQRSTGSRWVWKGFALRTVCSHQNVGSSPLPH